MQKNYLVSIEDFTFMQMCTAILSRMHRIPFDLRSKAGSGFVSTEVGDYSGNRSAIFIRQSEFHCAAIGRSTRGQKMIKIPSLAFNPKFYKDVKIPILGLGTYLAEGKTCYNIVKKALELGYRHIDTAAFYGNEEEVGRAIKESGIPREQIFVTTKMWYSAHGYESCLRAFEESLSKLGLDYVDLYLIHWPGFSGKVTNPTKKRAETWKAMEKIFNDGKAKAIGVSNYTLKHLKEMETYATVPPAINQVECHPLLTQVDIRNYCKEKNIVFESYSPFAKGELIDNKTIVDLAKKYNKTPAQILIRWQIQSNIVVIPKTSRESRAKENLDVFDWSLSEEDMKLIDGMNRDYHCTWDPTDIE